MDDVTLGEMLTAAHRGQVDYCVPGGMSVSQSSSVMFDGSGQLDGERMVNQSGQSGVTFNVISDHSNFSEDIQTEKMVDRSGQRDECNSSKAQIRTVLEEQKQTVLAECHARVSHHELQAAQAEEERRLLQGHLWRQKLEFREARQQSLAEMEELRKFQSSTFDTIARRKLIEDQNTILGSSGRVQELQNEVNCMNDSQDLQDAESVRSGNSNLTSRPVSFPPHPILGRDVATFFRIAEPQRRAAKHFGHTWFFGKRFFADPLASSSAPYPQELHQWNSSIEEPLHSSTVEKSARARTRSRSEMPVWTVSQRFSHPQWRRLLKELWGRPTTTAYFGSSFRQIPYTSYVCLLEDKIQDRGMYFFTISYGSYAMDQRSGDG